jgi:hypothetical protein
VRKWPRSSCTPRGGFPPAARRVSFTVRSFCASRATRSGGRWPGAFTRARPGLRWRPSMCAAWPQAAACSRPIRGSVWLRARCRRATATMKTPLHPSATRKAFRFSRWAGCILERGKCKWHRHLHRFHPACEDASCIGWWVPAILPIGAASKRSAGTLGFEANFSATSTNAPLPPSIRSARFTRRRVKPSPAVWRDSGFRCSKPGFLVARSRRSGRAE